MKTVLISGAKGQDGSYITELLLEKGYKVIAMLQRTSVVNYGHIDHLLGNENLIIEQGSLTDETRIFELIKKYKPDSVYNFGGISNRPACEATPLLAYDVNALGIVRILEAVRLFSPDTRVFQASSSDIFGEVIGDTQDENTICKPNTLYGIAKLSAHQNVKFYREKYGIFAVSGILYSHSSSRRGSNFVTRKITKAVANIKHGKQTELRLGNIDSTHDFGHAKDVVEVAWRALQYHKADDYTIGTGLRYTVRDFCRTAFEHVDLNYLDYVKIDQEFYQKQKNVYIADMSKTRRVLKHTSNNYTFTRTIKQMVDHDMEITKT